MMNTIPVAFAFDNNIVKPAVVCMTSLLENALPNTYYDIVILHAHTVKLDKSLIDLLPQKYENCRIRYVEIGDVFGNAFEIRGVTIATYYRLLLAELLPECDKIIYSDVDIIFRMDLAKVYHQDIKDYYVAASLDLGLNYWDTKHVEESPLFEAGKYIQAGFAVFNLKKIREDGLVSQFIEQAEHHKYTYQDQDILNICCKDKIKYLSPRYNVNDCAFLVLREPERLAGKFDIEECNYAREHGNIHYSGKKPWKENSVFFDIWWSYYRKSPIYNVDEYFDHFFEQTFLLDSLPLWERVKILVRYFLYGQSKKKK